MITGAVIMLVGVITGYILRAGTSNNSSSDDIY